jgi:hypothetical protein
MNRALPAFLAAAALLCAGVGWSSPRMYLIHDKRICDTTNEFCLRGSLTYVHNTRVLHLRGRVLTAPGPGLLRIRVTGANELGHRRSAPIEVRLRGNYSEIIDHRMIPDYPDVENWQVDSVVFVQED